MQVLWMRLPIPCGPAGFRSQGVGPGLWYWQGLLRVCSTCGREGLRDRWVQGVRVTVTRWLGDWVCEVVSAWAGAVDMLGGGLSAWWCVRIGA